MARLGVSKKKSSRTTELSQLKKEVQRLTEQLKSSQRELESSNTELRESIEQQTATSEILGVIASSPTNLQQVLDVVAENAARLCEAKDAVIWRVDGGMLLRVAVCGPNAIRRCAASHHSWNPSGPSRGRPANDSRTRHNRSGVRYRVFGI